jgi:hypothetical protein
VQFRPVRTCDRIWELRSSEIADTDAPNETREPPKIRRRVRNRREEPDGFIENLRQDANGLDKIAVIRQHRSNIEIPLLHSCNNVGRVELALNEFLDIQPLEGRSLFKQTKVEVEAVDVCDRPHLKSRKAKAAKHEPCGPWTDSTLSAG